MSDYSQELVYLDIGMVRLLYQAIGVEIVASKNDGAVLDTPPVVADTNGASGSADVGTGSGGLAASESPLALPAGFRRLGDLRKRAVRQTYDDLIAWVGKTIRLDGVNFKTEQKGDKTVIVSGEMTFSEFDPADPDREVTDEQVTTTAIPRGAIRALYAGLQANPDETIVCNVVKGKRGLALQ